jgi:uncharacterized protein YdhG (YjbR/CyaY superfamily)
MTSPKPTTIDDYIATLPEDRAAIVQKIRETIQQAVPEATETVAYDMPTFELNGHYLVYFAAWKSHIGLYPLYNADEPELRELFAPYTRERNSIHLPYDDPKLYEIIETFSHFRKQQETEHPSQG